MKKIILLIFISAHLISYGQGGTWTWMKGDNFPGGTGSVGTMGVTNAADYPAGRYQAAQWTDLNGNFWIFGGYSPLGLQNDLWKYNPATNNWTWVNGNGFNAAGIYGTMGVPSSSNQPGSRGRGVITWTDQQGHLWMYGGNGYDAFGNITASLGDMWMYDIPTNQWTWMNGSTTNNPNPVYGTLQVPSSSNTPGGRQECNTAWVNSDGTLWTFGGQQSSTGIYNDMWKYDIGTNQWTWMSGTQGITVSAYSYGTLNVEAASNLPPPRGTYTRWQDPNGFFYIFGGVDAGLQNYYNDVWKYNTANNRWTWISGSTMPDDPGQYTSECIPGNSALPPSRFENRTARTTGCTNVFWTFGGTLNSSLSSDFNDLWSFNTQSEKWTWVSGSNTLNALGNYGSMGVPAAGNMPPARAGVCLWVDYTGVLWMWSGYSPNGAIGDMWRFVPDTACLRTSLFISPISATISDSVICNGGASHVAVTGGTIVSVTPPAGSTLIDSADVSFHPAATTSYTVVASASCGVLDTFHYTIHVSSPPVASVQFVNGTINIGHYDSIINHSSGFDTAYAFLNGQPVYPIPTNLFFSHTGTYCLKLITVRGGGCIDSSTTCVVVKPDSCYPNITVTLSPASVCAVGDSSYLTITGVSHFTVTPSATVTPVDSNHAWLKPTVPTTYQIIISNLCGGLDTVPAFLNISAPVTTGLQRSICAGSSYSFNGQQLTTAGTYRDTLTGSNGCDSIIVLSLSVNNSIDTNITVAICPGSSYSFNGQSLTTAGTYRDTLTGSNGCDSIVILTLNIQSTLTTNITQSICSGSSIVFDGQFISTSGTYTATYQIAAGCDSVVTLTLTVLPPLVATVTANICSGESYNFNGSAISAAGVYSQTLTSLLGCDSIVDLTLTVSPKPVAGFSIVPIGDSVPLGNITVTNTSLNTDSILWLLNDQLVTLLRNNALPVTSTGNYCIRLIANSNAGCSDTTQQCIYVFEGSFAMPNAFSPNGDSKNELFYPVIFDQTNIAVKAFKIYNRWGQLIYEDPTRGWDGNYKGTAQPGGVYTYFVTVSLPDTAHPGQQKEIHKEGSFTLMH